MRGTEEGDFDRRVLGSVLGLQFVRLQRLIVTGEEHRFPVSERVVRGEESRADDTYGLRFRGRRAGGHRLTQGGFGGIQIGRQLDA